MGKYLTVCKKCNGKTLRLKGFYVSVGDELKLKCYSVTHIGLSTIIHNIGLEEGYTGCGVETEHECLMPAKRAILIEGEQICKS
jgi:hypothetical protein